MHHGDRAADVANLVRHCGHCDPRARQHLVQTRFLSGAELFRRIQNHRRQPRPRTGLVGRKAYLRKKRVAVLANSARLHHRPKHGLPGASFRNIGERREVAMDRSAQQRRHLYSEHPVCCLIRHQHAAARIRGDDRSRAAFNQRRQLLLRLQPRIPLGFDLVELLLDDVSTPVCLVNEHPDRKEGHTIKNVAGEPGAQAPDKRVELFREVSAEDSSK
jgi:hypothetical protein